MPRGTAAGATSEDGLDAGDVIAERGFTINDEQEEDVVLVRKDL